MNNTHIDFTAIKKFFSHTVAQAVLASFLTVLVTLSIVGGILWHYKNTVVRVLGLAPISSSIPALPALDTTSAKAVAELPVEKQNTVIDVVKAANPAVVSIIITKEIPKYDVTYENDPMFPGFFAPNPTYTQNGTEKKEIGSGSGFLVSADGYIVTNRHVVVDTGGTTFTVVLSNGKKYTARVLARDSVLDVAIIKIDGVSKLPYLNLGDSDTIDVGESVVAIGNALGQFKNSVSVGVVSGLSRSVVANDGSGTAEQLSKVIQTDAAINPGNSGGPLLDMKAEVIGVNVAMAQGSENIGFALPINSIKSVISSVKKTGKISRPYVGIRYVVITPTLKEKNNLSVDYGILITRGDHDSETLAVIPGSPADIAGIMENDIILSVDGQKIDQDKDFTYFIRGKNVGDKITLQVLSKGTYKTVVVKLAQAPDGQ